MCIYAPYRSMNEDTIYVNVFEDLKSPAIFMVKSPCKIGSEINEENLAGNIKELFVGGNVNPLEHAIPQSIINKTQANQYGN